MIEAQPSRTALRVAMRRAFHQLWEEPKVLNDPVILRLLGAEAVAELDGAHRSSSAGATSLLSFLVARSRYAEDQLALAVAKGVKQYVVLGAGLDTFAYRNPFATVKIFEVDHPATQAWKRELLEKAEIDIPGSLVFVPIDFEKDTLAKGLETAGFKKEEPSFFSWLGVVPYLARDVVLATLKWVIFSCGQNGVVFDYAVPRESLHFFDRLAFDLLARRVSAVGEPFVTFFDHDELERELGGLGFTCVENLNTEAINARFFPGRSDGLGVTGDFAGLICASGK